MPKLRREKRRLARMLWTLPVGPWRGVPLDDVPPRVLKDALAHMDLREGLQRRIGDILDERRRILASWLERMAGGRLVLVCRRWEGQAKDGQCRQGQGGTG